MTHQSNKHFNTYKEGLDLEVLRQYCMEHGEVRTFLRGETLEDVGEPAQWVAFVERGCFKYMVHNDEEGKDYCTGFAELFFTLFFIILQSQMQTKCKITTHESS
jgi:CRP-like cAMP-binding protein